MAAYMLTTKDNPYDPRLDFKAWDQWDRAQGYNTCAYLSRVLVETDDFPEEFQDREREQAMDEIIALHNGEIYQKLPIDEAA